MKPSPRRKRDLGQAWRLKIGEAISQAREREQLTQRELAKRAGVPQPNIARLELGQLNVTIETLARIASVLALEMHLKKAK